MSKRALAARFGVSPHAVWRHGKAHLTPAMRAAVLSAQRPTEIDLEALRITESEGLLSSLVAQRARLQAHSDLALEMGDIKAAVSVENSIRENLALVGKLLGMLVQHHEVRRTSILISADYLQLRAAILQALKPYPGAATAVSRALHDLETVAAKEINESKRPVMIEHAPVPAEGAAA